MSRYLAVICFIAAAVSNQPSHAQVMLDVAKITCTQWAGYKITNPQNIAFWLSGYYNGKRNNTVLDTQGLEAIVQKVRDFCIVNPDVPVMQAVEKVVGAAK